jgi:aminopeptidase-like protein
MNLMMKIIKDLGPLNRVFCSGDYDKSIDYLQRILPFQVIEYTKKDEHNGWIIAPRWDVLEAKILKNGKIIYDGTNNALAVIALSKSFRGKVDYDELKNHLHYDTRFDDAVPFHFRQMYRPWVRDWGFCATRKFYDSLEPGEYDVVIETRESEGTLKLLEYTHPGDLGETIVIAAHLDHPGMANDDMAGCAVGVELFRRLRSRRTKYTYKLLLHQEVIGSEYYLAKMANKVRGLILESLFLEMLGTKTQLALQFSRGGASGIEKALAEVLADAGVSHRTGPSGSIIAVGDYVWETYGIPMGILSRFPYPEYHCSRDDFALMNESALEEAVNILLKAIEKIESTSLVFKKFQGTICTSNPRYNLYVDPGQPAFGGFSDDSSVIALRALMEIIPMLQRPVSVRALAEQVGIEESLAQKYLEKWVAKGLLEIK